MQNTVRKQEFMRRQVASLEASLAAEKEKNGAPSAPRLLPRPSARPCARAQGLGNTRARAHARGSGAMPRAVVGRTFEPIHSFGSIFHGQCVAYAGSALLGVDGPEVWSPSRAEPRRAHMRAA